MSRKTRSNLGQKPRQDMVGLRSQKPPILLRRNIIRKGRSLTREWFNVTYVIGLATLLRIVGQTRKASKKKQT